MYIEKFSFLFDLILKKFFLFAGKQKPIYVAVIFGMHLLLAVGFMQYFFHVPSRTVVNDINDIQKTTLVNLPKPATNSTLSTI